MPVFATLIQLRAGGFVIGPDPFFRSQIEQLAAPVLDHAVPAVYEWREFAVAGGLLSYRIIIRNHSGFERLVIFWVLKFGDQGLSGETVTYGIAPRTSFAFCCPWSSAFKRVEPVGFYLFEGAH
jgi:hypothetical protein